MADFNTYTNSTKTSIVVRYEVHNKWFRVVEMREFNTKQAAQWFLDHQLPKHAKNIDIWFTDNEERKQKPTWYHEPKLSTKWWDANKRPFEDRYEREEQR